MANVNHSSTLDKNPNSDSNTEYSDAFTISFNTKDDETNGFYELLLKKIPVRSTKPHKYIVPARGLQILRSLQIKFNEER